MPRFFFLVPLALLVGCAEAPLDPAPYGDGDGTSAKHASKDDGTLTPSTPARGNIDEEAPTSSTSTTTSASTSTTRSTAATVTLDGAVQEVTSLDLWAPDADGDAHLFVRFEGKGAPAGTDLHLSFTKAATGCLASPAAHPQDLWLRPPATADQYRSVDGAACGLVITSFPTNVGDALVGRFDGKVTGINGAAGKTRSLAVTFTFVRTR